MNNMSAILTTSIDSRNDNSYTQSKNYQTKPKPKRVKKVKTKSFRNVETKPAKSAYLKHSASSGSFNKLKAFEKPCLKQSRHKYGKKFMVERKQINLQSDSRENSKKRLDRLIKTSRAALNLVTTTKTNKTHLYSKNITSRNLKTSQVLHRTRSNITASMLTNRSVNKSDSKLPNLSNMASERVSKPKKLKKDRSAQILARIGKSHFSHLKRGTPEGFYHKY